MNQWTEPRDITKELQKKWQSGRLLKETIAPGGLYPISIKIKGPHPSELSERFSETSQWIKRLREDSKIMIGYGYLLVEKEKNYKQSGRNTIPTHAIVETAEDALKLLKKSKDAEKFASFVQSLLCAFPESRDALQEWVGKYPLKALDLYEEKAKIFSVLNWFLKNPKCNLYLRQLDIEGIDTKFIEQRKSILSELLDMILPSEEIKMSAKKFEERYGIQAKPPTIRFRFLDAQLYFNGLSDIQTPIEQFRVMNPEVIKVFITENEINGLSFPGVPQTLVIFGLGYGVDLLKSVDWLREKEIYYWGDIDTHGFSILNQVRSFLPQTQSMLMDKTTLLRYRTLWSVEEKPFQGVLENLSIGELFVYELLRTDVHGKGVRLEQERIPFSEVLQFFCTPSCCTT